MAICCRAVERLLALCWYPLEPAIERAVPLGERNSRTHNSWFDAPFDVSIYGAVSATSAAAAAAAAAVVFVLCTLALIEPASKLSVNVCE